MNASEKSNNEGGSQKPKKAGHRDRVICMRSHSFPPEYHEENPMVRAVYLSRTPCLQTFHSHCTRYFNFLVRPLETTFPFSHWSLVITPELPGVLGSSRSGECPFPRRVIEMGAALPDRKRGEPTVGSFDSQCPVRNRPYSRLLYIGATILSDPEITKVALLITDYLKEEGRYHGIFRNCQHWIYMLTSILCPNAKLPRRVDQTQCAIFYLFKHSNKDMQERVEKVNEYCRQRIAAEHGRED